MKNLLKYINWFGKDKESETNDQNYQKGTSEVYVHERNEIQEQEKTQDQNKKTLDVLVVDDLPENLRSAEKMFEGFKHGNYDKDAFDRETITEKDVEKLKSYEFRPHYTDNASSALEIINSVDPQIILSDVFFHYYKNETPQKVREELKNFLGPYGVTSNEEIENQLGEPLWAEAAKNWYDGNDTPPMGVYIFLNKNKNSSLIYNSENFHHEQKYEPVNKWMKYNGVYLVSRECTGEYKKTMAFEDRPSPKDWTPSLFTGIWIYEEEVKGPFNTMEEE